MLTAWPAVDCSTRIRRSCVDVSSSRSDNASGRNGVMIAVKNAAFMSVRIINTTPVKASLPGTRGYSCFSPILLSSAGPVVPQSSHTYSIRSGELRLAGRSLVQYRKATFLTTAWSRGKEITLVGGILRFYTPTPLWHGDRGHSGCWECHLLMMEAIRTKQMMEGEGQTISGDFLNAFHCGSQSRLCQCTSLGSK